MKEELDKALVNDFPLLYRDRNASMQSTCMCWGFPGNGWEPLIRELSSKLEPLIQKWIDENKPKNCANCGCDQSLHDWVFPKNELPKKENLFRAGGCFNIHYLPYVFKWKWKSLGWPSKAQNWNDRWKIFKAKYVYYGLIERVKRWISRGINFVLDNILHKQFGVTKKKPCHCTKYLLNQPCASQVKEKMGGLRVYMTSGTDEMYELIDEAGHKSYHVCETCGNKGDLRWDHGWYSTLCDTHAIDLDGNRIPTAKEVNDESATTD